MAFEEFKRVFGSLSILVGDGASGVAVFTVGEAGVDPDMSAALVYSLEQAMRDHSASARDVFFGGLSPDGGLGWCVRRVTVAGESRELYVGIVLSPGEKYTYNVNILEQEGEGAGFFRFLKENLLGRVVEALEEKLRGETFEEFVGKGRKIGFAGRDVLRGVDDLGEAWRILSEAYGDARRSTGFVLEALTRDGKRVDGEAVVEEAAREFLRGVFEGQGEGTFERVLRGVRVAKSVDEAFTHVWLSSAECCCEVNPAFLLLAGGGRRYLDVWRKVLKDLLRKWREEGVGLLLSCRFGEDDVLSGGFRFEREELFKSRDSVLEAVGGELEEKLRGSFPLLALAFDVAGEGVVKELARYVFNLVQAIQERIFREVKGEVFGGLRDDRLRLLYYGLTADEMRRKVDEFVDGFMDRYEEELYSVSSLLLLPSPVMEKARMEVREDLWERVMSLVVKGQVPALLSALRRVKGGMEGWADAYLNVMEDALRDAAGEGVTALLPALGYALRKVGVLDGFVEELKRVYGEAGFPAGELEDVIRRIKSGDVFLSGSFEDVLKAGYALLRGVRRSLSSWLSGVLLDDDGRVPVLKMLYQAYVKTGREVNGAFLAFNVLKTLLSEMERAGVSDVERLASACNTIYGFLAAHLRKVKVSGEAKLKKKVERVARKHGASFSSLSQLLSYVRERKRRVWEWVLGGGKGGELVLVPPVATILEEASRFYLNASEKLAGEVEFARDVLSLLKSVGVHAGRDVKDALDFLAGEAKKLRRLAGVQKRIDEVVEGEGRTFREAEAFEEIVEGWSVDPFFKGKEDFLGAYIGQLLWEDVEDYSRLVGRAVKASAGFRDESPLVREAAKRIRMGEDASQAVRSVLSEYMAAFTRHVETQSMRVELAFLSRDGHRILSNRKADYSDFKVELQRSEGGAVEVDVEDGKPYIVLGEVDTRFFPRGERDVEECLRGFGEFRVSPVNGRVMVRFKLPSFGGSDGKTRITSLVRAYAWGMFLQENGGKLEGFKELLALVGSKAQQELEMFKEFLRCNVFRAIS
ncbi:MAG: hypothetical protein ACTSWP_03515 [Candidatus Freyarchaeota archaeon]